MKNKLYFLMATCSSCGKETGYDDGQLYQWCDHCSNETTPSEKEEEARENATYIPESRSEAENTDWDGDYSVFDGDGEEY